MYFNKNINFFYFLFSFNLISSKIYSAKMNIAHFIRASFFLAVVFTNAFSDGVIVQTTYGKLRGFQIQFNDSIAGQKVNAFLGVPFSQPPIGALRFEVYFIVKN